MLWGRQLLWWAQRSQEELDFPCTKIIFPDQKLWGSGAGKTGDEMCVCVDVVMAVPNPINHSSAD